MSLPPTSTRKPAYERGTPSARQYSPSVQGVIQRLGPEQSVNSWEIVQTLLEVHEEYGHGAAKSVGHGRGPASGETKPVAEWMEEVEGVLHPDWSGTLHGRTLILGLARVDSALDEYLSELGFLEAVRSEIQEPLERVFATPPTTTRSTELSDRTPLHVDNPALVDLLGRRSFAYGLARRLERIWHEYQDRPTRSSFILHLHGPWGAGKTTLLQLLRSELQPRSSASESHTRASAPPRWIVVEFNAWQHQRLDPPWWPLHDAVYRQAKAQLGSVFGDRPRAWRLALRELGWRLVTGRRDTLTAIVLLIIGALLLYAGRAWIAEALEWLGIRDPATAETAVELLSKLLTLAAVILSPMLVVSRTLLSGSARAAQSFVQAASDPLERVYRHFGALVRAIRQPVLVCIDDLDRCQPTYVVNLLEGIQTLFNDPRVVYILSADRRWIHACFEKQYEPFAATVTEPGRRLGSLFLEKAVQLSVTVPRLSPETQRNYWRSLIAGDRPNGASTLKAIEMEVRAEFGATTTEPEILERLDRASADPLRQEIRRQVAVEHLATTHVEESTSYFLEQFAPLLEPNPRSMKRLLNAYTVHRDLAILAGINVLGDIEKRKQLALWTILSLRWPAVEEFLVQQAADPNAEATPDVQALLHTDAVQSVIDCKQLETMLDPQTVGLFAGIRSSDAAAGAVA
jgi:hypothetical protein